MRTWLRSLLALCYFYGIGIVCAQTTPFSNEGGEVICVWNEVTLRQQPGKTAPYVTGVYFGEAVQKTGAEAYAPDERRTYIEVTTSEGLVGWVHEFLFVQGSAMAVVLQSGRIYKRPRTVSTITDQHFMPGDLVVVAGSSHGWLHLIGREKKKAGWIEGTTGISENFRDLELASLLYDADQKTRPAERKEALKVLLNEAQVAGSPLRMAIGMRLTGQEDQLAMGSLSSSTTQSDLATLPQGATAQRSVTSQAEFPAADPQSNMLNFQSGYYSSSTSSSRHPRPLSTVSESDHQTGRPPFADSRQSVPQSRTTTEWHTSSPSLNSQRMSSGQPAGTQGDMMIGSGTVTVINSHPGEQDIFYAYMRDVAIGSKVYVDIPGNPGFIEVRIIGRLPPESAYSIGLPVACFDALLGNTTQRQLSFRYQP